MRTLAARTVVLGLITPLLGIAGVTTAGPAAASTPCAQVEVLAHRGVHTATIDENTLAAYDGAAAGGFSLETDIRADADGVLWVFHDRDPFRATGTSGTFDQMSTSQVSALRYRESGSRVLPYNALLAWMVRNPGVRTYIEPKMKFLPREGRRALNIPKEIVRRLINLGLTDRSWITSFREALPADPAVGLLDKALSGAPDPQTVADAGYDTVSLGPVDMTPGNVAAYHRLGIAVHADESDKHWVWRRAVAAGADAVLTDVPADVSPDCQGFFNA